MADFVLWLLVGDLKIIEQVSVIYYVTFLEGMGKKKGLALVKSCKPPQKVATIKFATSIGIKILYHHI